jgi:SAM-dependent methyltransferase
MSPEEIAAMAAVEDEHWWYRGLRDLLARLLTGPLRLPEGARLLDAGCGTGANLRLLAEVVHPSYLGGFDLSDEALAWAKRKAAGADLYRSDLRAPELRTADLDCVTCLDVAYIPGLAACAGGLAALAGALRPGGLLVLHLPAFSWLRSEHDLAVAGSERFTVAHLAAALARLGLEPVRLTYRVFWLFPAIVALRLPRRPAVAPRRAPHALPRSDLRRYRSTPFDRLCAALLRSENRRIAAGGRFPWGSSVVAVGRKS